MSPLLEQLLDHYTDRIKIVFKHFPLPFHKEAVPAALASIAADEQGRFWEMHDLLFENSTQLSKEKIMGLAVELGLDMKRFVQDVESRQTMERLNRDRQSGVTAGVKGTPTVFVNGRRLKDRSFEGFSELIDKALAEVVQEVK